jgi:hypothetical protein
MLTQEKTGGSETFLKLSVAIDEDRKALRSQVRAKHLPRAPRGGTPLLSAAEVLTILVYRRLAWPQRQSQGLLPRADVSSSEVPGAGGVQ